MRWLLDAVYLVALLLLSPWLLWRAWRTGRYRDGLRQKLLGLTAEMESGAVWFHGVSVGEVHLLRQLVAVFRQQHPDRRIVISSTTNTGLEEARKHFSDLVVFAFPFDFSWAVQRTLMSVKPALVVLGESELWPNFVAAANRLDIPVAVVNGRMSPRTLARYQMIAPLVRWLFESLKLVAMQTEEYAANVLSLGGVPGQVVITGNIKYDGAITDRQNPITNELRTLLDVKETDLVWVAGSTQAPEEEIVLDVYQRAKQKHSHLRLFVVPRQRDRFDEVAALIEKKQIPFIRRSLMDKQSESPAREAPGVVLMDTIGELGALWGLADLAFVGGSLDGRRGGQNMIEPAGFGVAVTFGPSVWNFKEPAKRLCEVGGAYQVKDSTELEEVTSRLLVDVGERQSAGVAARKFVLAQQGATERTVALLDMLLKKADCQKAA
jgi:3-deoxy-D-manno-octulosonic-acid transferase